MSEKKSTEQYTTCPFSGQENGWVEKEGQNGQWRGYSTATGSSISAENYDALRLRYKKLMMAYLGEGQPTE